MSTWTEDRTNKLATLWRDGYSGSAIANLMGGLTRGAVLGKVWRLSLPARPSSPTKRADTRPRHVQKPKQIQPHAPILGSMLKVTMADLEPGMCRWPFGDPKSEDFRYCGLDAGPKHPSYCGYHACLSYEAPAQRRARAGWITRRRFT